MAFDLGAMLANVSDSDTGREQIEYIDLTYLDDDPNNFYTLSGLDELADNIATCGLQQPIRVRRNPDVEGRYIIVSGHRRRAALDLLVKEDAVKWSSAPCIVERDDVSPALQQLRLIYANAHTRKLTPAEISEEAVQVEKLLYQLKEEGHEFPGRMRDHVAKAVGANTTKLARLKVIRERLIPTWESAFKKGTLPESTAYALAQLSDVWQRAMWNAYREHPSWLYESRVSKFSERMDKLGSVKCKRGCIDCRGNMARLERIAKMDTLAIGCSGCCAECPDLARCSASCPACCGEKDAAKKRRREERAAEKSDIEAREKPVIDSIQGVYARVGEARKKAGKSVEDMYRVTKRFYSKSDKDEQEQRERGKGKISTATSLPFGSSFAWSDARNLVAVADLLGCSIDWLLGRDVPGPLDAPTEPEKPVASVPIGWQSGSPDVPGEYAVFGHYLGGSPDVTSLEWKDDGWYEFDEPLMAFEVAMWAPFPEVK